VRNLEGTIELLDGSTLEISRESFTADSERALKALAAAVVSLAVALVFLRVT
jgi:hypothetical protein